VHTADERTNAGKPAGREQEIDHPWLIGGGVVLAVTLVAADAAPPDSTATRRRIAWLSHPPERWGLTVTMS
jgi:hypothetical protein